MSSASVFRPLRAISSAPWRVALPPPAPYAEATRKTMAMESHAIDTDFIAPVLVLIM